MYDFLLAPLALSSYDFNDKNFHGCTGGIKVYGGLVQVSDTPFTSVPAGPPKPTPNETVIVYDTIIETEPDVCDGDAYKLTSDEVCPDSGDIVQLLKANADGPTPVIYGVEFVPSHDDTHGNEVSFHVGNPNDSNVKTYVRYEKNIGWFANDPACDKQVDVAPGCQESSNKITAGCIKYPGREPFALVNVYMASEDLVGDAEIIKCCDPDDDGFGVVKYAFKIQCGCPDIA